MFVGRKNELNELQEGYDSGTFQCVVLYGRRRIGKTYLISRFIEDKPAIFYTAQEVNDKLNLSHFTEKVLGFFKMGGFWDRVPGLGFCFQISCRQGEGTAVCPGV